MDMRPPIVYSVEVCASRRNHCAMHSNWPCSVCCAHSDSVGGFIAQWHVALVTNDGVTIYARSPCVYNRRHGIEHAANVRLTQSIPLRQSCGVTREHRMRIVGNAFSRLWLRREFSFCILAIDWSTCCHVLAWARFSSASAGASTSSVIDAAAQERERAPRAFGMWAHSVCVSLFGDVLLFVVNAECAVGAMFVGLIIVVILFFFFLFSSIVIIAMFVGSFALCAFD